MFHAVLGHPNTVSRISMLIVGSALLLWVSALASVDLEKISNYGLVTALPWQYFVALGLLIISFSLVIQYGQTTTSILFIHIITLILIIRGTTAVLYDVPRFSWTYWMIGVTDYIQRNGAINPRLDFYFNFPGFFALNAFFNEVIGIESALSYANWMQSFFNIIYLGPLLLIFRAFTTDKRLIWLAVWFFYLANWVNQDTLVPQALNYLFYQLIISLCINWFYTRRAIAVNIIGQWFGLHRLLNKTTSTVIEQPADGFQLIVSMGIIVTLGAAIATGHPLTPYMLIISTTVLVLFQRCRARWLPVLFAVITVAWLIFMATAFLQGQINMVLAPIGQVGQNLNVSVYGLLENKQEDRGRMIYAVAVLSLTIGIWLLGLLGLLRRLRFGYLDLTTIILALAPMFLPILQSYGGEVMLRVYFFSLPYIVFLAAALFFSHPSIGTTWQMKTLIVIVSAFLSTCLIISYFGNEKSNYISRNDVEALEFIYDQLPHGSQILIPSGFAPTKFREIENYSFRNLNTIPGFWMKNLPDPDLMIIKEIMDNNKYTANYLLITRSQKESAALFRLLPDEWINKLEWNLRQSSDFQIVYENPDAIIFGIVNSSQRMESQ